MSDTVQRDGDNEKTVVMNTGEIELKLNSGLSEETTVLDTGKINFQSIFDPELEQILRETEGYELPADEPSREREENIPESKMPRRTSNAERVIREQEEKRRHAKRKKLIIVCAALVAVLAVMLAIILALKSGGTAGDYNESLEQAQEYYNAGDYDGALELLRQALEIKKTDECLKLMSRCYEAKYDYVNAIAILESSNSGASDIKTEIERLQKAKEDYDSGKIVVICGEQYDVGITVLDLSKKDAGSAALKDVGKLTELVSLKLSGNKITSLDFLKPLKNLTSLDLSDNSVSDLGPLKNLTSLRTLHLDNNDISDFSPLYGLGSLSMLTIGDIEISSSQLKTLKEKLPTCIIYSDKAKEDVIEIKLGGKTFKSDVTELDLSSCNVRDITLLSVCTKLTKLDLSDNSISDLSPLVDLPELRELDISGNNISDASPLMSLPKLEYLNLADNEVRSVAALTELTALTELNLSGNGIGSLTPISGLTGLKNLWLDDTGLTDATLTGLYSLKSLKVLSIRDNAALSESGVNALQKKLPGCRISHSELRHEVVLGGKSFDFDTETVEANELGISDISAVAGFTKVKHLDLSNNSISKLSPLKNLKTLETLDLTNNSISDVTALYSLTSLRQLWIGGNSLTDDQIKALEAALPDCYISVE